MSNSKLHKLLYWVNFNFSKMKGSKRPVTRYEWIAFFYLTFWTTFAPLVLFLQILLENLFEVFLQIVKGIWIRLQEAFSRFEISPLFQMLFLWLHETPPEWHLLLVFKRVLKDSHLENLPLNILIEEIAICKISMEILLFQDKDINWDIAIVGGLLRSRRSCKKKHLRKISMEITPKLPYRELRHNDMPKMKGCTDLKMKRQIDSW
jgi:hypothetical protein